MTERTQIQSDDEERRAAQLSRQRRRPPTEVPGLEPERFLGAGAYGEVWVALDRNTGRRVAIKFFAHHSGLDWSQLHGEVQKLVFLSADRYVVQLLDVGWTAQPPYYVMEYIERGSLDDRLREEGTLPVGEALALFRDVATGLAHAHGRGILHCDLKPANILLDQDQRPRLADFGQSRLSDEQKPALGTLFYMAPEQADTNAAPNARWDVYALGALLFTMLTGAPPHRNDAHVSQIERSTNLEDRLARYRRIIAEAPTPTAHRDVPHVDRALVEIIDRCLAVRPDDRYLNVQSVIDALDERDARRARRPLVVLGMIGPMLLVLLMGLAAWRGLQTVTDQTDVALTQAALESNRFAAQFAAETAANDLEQRFFAVEDVLRDTTFRDALATLLEDDRLGELRAALNDPQTNPTGPDTESGAETIALRERFRNHPRRQALQARLEGLMDDPRMPSVASWFVDDAHGLQVARSPESQTIGQNYGWRTYFHGGAADFDATRRPTADEHLRRTQLSAVFLSQASGKWILGVSTPIIDEQGQFLGVIALTVMIGDQDFGVRVSEPTKSDSPVQHAILVDWRDGPNKGLVVQHPLYGPDLLPERFKDFRIASGDLPAGDEVNQRKTDYRDPLANGEGGREFTGRWLADSSPVRIRGQDSALRVIVQMRHAQAIAPLRELTRTLLTIGLIALAGMGLVLTLLWGFVIRGFSATKRAELPGDASTNTTPADTMATIAYRGNDAT